ncbi:hypothetical protein JHK82_044457 [Glycine max]|nr:hypothetical protein JHK82_044457 [Glycine max]
MDGCDNMVEFVKEDYGNSGRGRKRYHDCGPLLRFHGSSEAKTGMTGYDGGSVGMKEIWGKVANGRDLLGSVVDGVIVGATVVVEFRDAEEEEEIVFVRVAETAYRALFLASIGLGMLKNLVNHAYSSKYRKDGKYTSRNSKKFRNTFPERYVGITN